MISVVLAVCLAAPLYVDIGPCLPGDACHCTDLEWDASPGATRYEIQRTTISSGTTITAGICSAQYDDDGMLVLYTGWPFARDYSFPHAGTSYRYRVRACNDAGCSEWSAPADNSAWPYACYDAGRETQCYTGDPVISR